MKRLFQISALTIMSVLLASWSFTDKNSAVLMITDNNEKISLLEHGKVDKEIFSKGIKALSVMHKQEKFRVISYMVTYVPVQGDAAFMPVIQENGQAEESRLSVIVKMLNNLKENDKIIVDNIQTVNKQGEKIPLPPIVLYVK